MPLFLTDALSALWRIWRGPEPHLAERAAEIRGRIARWEDSLLERLFDEFITACIQSRALRRPSAMRKRVEKVRRGAGNARLSVDFPSKSGGIPSETVENSDPDQLSDEAFCAFDRLEWERFLGVDEGRGRLH